MKALLLVALLALAQAKSASAASISVGAASSGDAAKVANKIIKYNFPTCKRVANAQRRSDGAIQATCDGTQYLVFTVFNAKEGRAIELALNCTAAKKSLNVLC